MQTVSPTFTALSVGDVRPLNWQVRAAFTRSFDPSVTFFILDQSLLDGPDLLTPNNDTGVVNEWDKYEYLDITSRVLSVEVTRDTAEPYSVVQAIADITLDNHDGLFDPFSTSPLGPYILPNRPFRILMGFGVESVPMFVGLSDMPDIDRGDRTIRFHCVDFLSWLFEKPVDHSVTIVGQNTGYILDYLFTQMGLTAGQFYIDPTSFNVINYFYADKGQKFGDIVQKLLVAEQGRLYQDEMGIIRYLNRQNYPDTPSFSFDKTNTLNLEVGSSDEIINWVEIKSKVLGVQPLQNIWEMAEDEIINGSFEIWADLADPVIGVNTPTLQTSEIEDSFYIGAGLTLSSMQVFSRAVKLVFTGSGTLSRLVLWGEPVRQIDEIKVIEVDQSSIDDFGIKVYDLDTNYIQSRDRAVGLAIVMVQDYKDYGAIVEITVKGTPALQIGDVVNLNLDGFVGDFYIKRKVDIMQTGNYTQRLICQKKSPVKYFILDQSLLNGPDVLAPF